MSSKTAKKINKLLAKAIKLFESSHYNDAEHLCQTIFKIESNHTAALDIFGRICYAQKRYHDAEHAFSSVLKTTPGKRNALVYLFNCYRNLHHYSHMLNIVHHLERTPEQSENTLLAYSAYLTVCDWDNAKRLQERILDLLERGQIHQDHMSGFLFDLNTPAHIDPQRIFNIHKYWGDRNIKACEAARISFIPTPTPQQRIKIAYLSADFNQHAVGWLIQPILDHHDRNRFEVYCYAHVHKDDFITDKIRNNVEHFVNITTMSSVQTAMRINRDGIHILIELGGHTESTQLPLLGFKPAPVQISYLGYPNTTGMDCVDFRITDQHADVKDGTIYTEELLYMPESFITMYKPHSATRTERSPAVENGYVTFGSFNNVRKLNPAVIKTWSAILHAVPESRMLIKSPGCETEIVKANILKAFALHDIQPERIEFAVYTNSYNEHTRLYNRVDIALDTFPYHGTHTTCESLWMGVPVITLEGKLHVQRVSSSILKNIGYEVTIASSEDEYITKAVELAVHPENLSVLRQCLHTLFSHSIVCNPKKVTHQLEDLYLEACRKKGIRIPAHFDSVTTETTTLPMPDGISIVLPDTLENETTYIITEQGDWYEDEIRFLRNIVKPGMRILDLQAGYGCYALSMAKQTGNNGAVLAIETETNKRSYLEKSAEENSFSCLHIGASDSVSAFVKEGVDLIIHTAEKADAKIFQQVNIPEVLSPIVMLHAMQDNALNIHLIQHMQKQQYMPYRLVSALHLLIPLAPEGFVPASWHRQVFFCKQNRAEQLSRDGMLLLHELESIDLPDDLLYWQQAFKHRSYANELLPLWIEQIQEKQTSSDWEEVRNALSAYAMAHQNDSTPQQCYAYLSASLNLLLNTEGLQSSTARLCTVVRIASELGDYTTAIQAAQMMHEGITTLQTFSPNEPFLPASSIYDHDNFQDHIAEWALAQSIAQIDLLKNPTSFWGDYSELLKNVSILRDIGFMDDTLCRRELLIHKRMLTNDKQALMVFDRLSPDMWRMLRGYYADEGKEKNQNLVLAIPNGEDRDKINLYLQNMCSFETATDLAVQIIVSNAVGSQKQFLHDLLQQSGLLHAPKTSSTTLQDMAVRMAKETGLEVVWHDEKPDFMPNPLPPVEDFRVTIMLTTYNRVKLLKRAVESILKQTYDDFVLVIHDDASSDGTEEYCTKLARNNTKIRYRRNKENLGAGVNGADMSQVETELMMGFTDDDFLLSSIALEKMVNAFRQHPQIGIAFGQCHLGDVYAQKTQTKIPLNLTTDCILDPHQMLLDSIVGNNIYGAGHVFRLLVGGDLLEEYANKYWPGKIDMGLEGDYLAGLRACVVTSIAYVHVPTIYYSLWPETITSSQLGGGWGMNVRLRTVAFLDDMYIRHFGHTKGEDQRIQQMAGILEDQFKKLKQCMSEKKLIEHKYELEYYIKLMTCIKKHKLPEVLLSTTLL